jgi:hypothetical protein
MTADAAGWQRQAPACQLSCTACLGWHDFELASLLKYNQRWLGSDLSERPWWPCWQVRFVWASGPVLKLTVGIFAGCDQSSTDGRMRKNHGQPQKGVNLNER